MTDDQISIAARAARELLQLRDEEPELFAQVMKLLSTADVETLREMAAWDRDTDGDATTNGQTFNP